MEEKKKKPGSFQKGDPRINRRGRPKTFNALRDLARSIAHEAKTENGDPVIVDGHIVTVAEKIMRDWSESDNPVLQQRFIEVAFGKVPENIDVTTREEVIVVKMVDD